MIEDKVVKGGERVRKTQRDTHAAVVKMKSTNQWIRTPLTTPHS